jgi:oxygen-independent coproporphyrinogen-3 oxidase
MSGIYLHIPFCRQACHYCDFHFSTSVQTKEAVLRCMKQELEMRREEMPFPIHTIYFGGGTPSLLKTEEILQLLDSVFTNYQVLPNVEITLEANPDDLSAQKLKELRNTPINRLSIGVQSFHELDLKYLHRIHSARQAEYAIKGAQDAGFENLTIDLIYGIPTLSENGWMENLERTIALQVPHVSAYALTVEEQTPLFHLIRRKKAIAPPDDQATRDFMMMTQVLPMAGFEQYEISNFAQSGFRSRHNSSYWKGLPYLGIGPSAHSFDGENTRRWNVANNVHYIQGIIEGTPWFEKEHLTFENRVNEWIMIRLRTYEGIDIKETGIRFGSDVSNHIVTTIQNLNPGWYELKDQMIKLTSAGMLMADHIASELMIEPQN